MNVYLTVYCPFQSGLTPAQRKQEGGKNDRRGKPLHTLEDHITDPVSHPYVSCAGDDAVFSYGQRLTIPAIGVPSEEWTAKTGETDYIARVVDTGGDFRGAGKVVKVDGYEPIDVCVDSCKLSSVDEGPHQATVVNEGPIKNALNALGAVNTSASTGLVIAGLVVVVGGFVGWLIWGGE